MPKGLLARKVGMTQVFTERGTVVPVTVLESDTCHVVQRKTTPVDGYEAVQIGFGEQKPSRVSKPLSGHYKRAGLAPHRELVELRDAGEATVGTRLLVDMFTEGQLVDVSGISQGKGFSGTVKRHGFHRGPVSHGSMNTRQPGSIGSVDAARTFKGVKMSGQYGNVRRTIRHLEVVRVDAERNLLLVKGSVPGHRNAVVLVRPSDREEVFS